jgi:hypothetical protein
MSVVMKENSMSGTGTGEVMIARLIECKRPIALMLEKSEDILASRM